MAGTALLMWMAEQINNYGIGNGISVILFAGIVARAPSVLSNMISYVKYGQLNIFVVLGIAVVAVLLVALVVLVTNAERRIPVQYAKEGRGPQDLRRTVHPHPAQSQRNRRSAA